MKMRVMYATKKGKFITYAEAIGAACGCLVNDIPPAYPADKERLVLIGVSVSPNSDPEDRVRRFCSELTPDKAAFTALFIDGEKDTDAEKQIREILAEAGTRVIGEAYYVKCGRFGKKITLQERQHIVDWARKMQEEVIAQNGTPNPAK